MPAARAANISLSAKLFSAVKRTKLEVFKSESRIDNGNVKAAMSKLSEQKEVQNS